MSWIRLFVSLKVPDNTAISAHAALQRRMGYSSLSHLKRSDFWEMEFPGASHDEARQAAETLVRKTACFVNPNKHNWSLQIADSPASEGASAEPGASAQASVMVCDIDDSEGQTVLSALQRRPEGFVNPSRLVHGVWWDLRFDDGVSSDEIKTLTGEMSLATRRDKGLFANPHYQTVQLFFS